MDNNVFQMMPEQVEHAKSRIESLKMKHEKVEEDIRKLSDASEHKAPICGEGSSGNGYTNVLDEIVEIKRIEDEISTLTYQINNSTLPNPTGDEVCIGSLVHIATTKKTSMYIMIVEGFCPQPCFLDNNQVRLCTINSPMGDLLNHSINDTVVLSNGQQVVIVDVDNLYIQEMYVKNYGTQKTMGR